jgi:ADP-ribose pyrophosphatase YjhB (NUDIX family)
MLIPFHRFATFVAACPTSWPDQAVHRSQLDDTHQWPGMVAYGIYAARMPVPEFVLELRAKIGHAPLTLPGVTAVVLDDADRILLVRRADSGEWTLVTGCLEPGEQPTDGALREIEEETAVTARIERLLGVSALPLMTCANGDQVYWFDTAYACRAESADARVNDDESTDVGWFTIDALPDLPSRHRTVIADALAS